MTGNSKFGHTGFPLVLNSHMLLHTTRQISNLKSNQYKVEGINKKQYNVALAHLETSTTKKPHHPNGQKQNTLRRTETLCEPHPRGKT